jgi:hypothetical protein
MCNALHRLCLKKFPLHADLGTDRRSGEVRLTVNGALSLSEVRTHYAQCGAASPRFLPYVRKPQVTEQ